MKAPFLRVSGTDDLTPGRSHNRNVFCPHPGGWKPRLRCHRASFPSPKVSGRIPVASSGFWGSGILRFGLHHPLSASAFTWPLLSVSLLCLPLPGLRPCPEARSQKPPGPQFRRGAPPHRDPQGHAGLFCCKFMRVNIPGSALSGAAAPTPPPWAPQGLNCVPPNPLLESSPRTSE